MGEGMKEGKHMSMDGGSFQAPVSQHALPTLCSHAASNYLAIKPWAGLAQASEGLRPVIYSFFVRL